MVQPHNNIHTNTLFMVKNGICLMMATMLLLCSCHKVIIDNAPVNTDSNSKYKKSLKAYSGYLNKTEYAQIIRILETELKTTIPPNKSILINYHQKAPNCIGVKFDETSMKSVIANGIRISSELSLNNNAVDFFVYSKDSYFRHIYEQTKPYLLDSGFLYNNIFTDHENCEGFIIIKPTGAFYKYYGEDYFYHAQVFFEKE